MNLRRMAFVIGVAGLAVYGVPEHREAAAAPSRPAAVTLHDVRGNVLGRVRVNPAGRASVRLRVKVQNLPPGFHGFHVHAAGKCEADAPGGPFVSAGPHLDPGAHGHGGHAGDLPNLLVGEDGTGRMEVTTDRIGMAALRDADGSAFVVHALPDNHANIPPRYGQPGGPDAETAKAGDSGGRIACGAIA